MTIDRYRRGGAAGLFASGLVVSGLMLGGGAAGAQTVGSVGAVNPASASTPPGEPTRAVELGNPVIYRERVVTSATGSMQLAFLDKSTLSIGPNSDLVIDEYIYDPNAGKGRMAVTLTRGALRFVGGKISHGTGAELRTPVATIGIRGGAGTISHDENGTQVISNFGRFTIGTPQGTTEIRRPGFGVTVPNAASAPGTPVRVEQATVDATTRRLSSSPDQNGGAPEVPNDAVAAALIGATTARTNPASIVPLGGNASDREGASPPGLGALTAANGIGSIIQNATANAAAAAAQPPGEPPPGEALQAGAFAMTMTRGAGGRMPYVSGAVAGEGQVVVSPVLGYRTGGTGPDAASVRAMQVGFNLSGEGSEQSSALVVAIGDYHRRGKTHEVSGGFNMAARVGAGSSESFATGSLASVPGSIVLGGQDLPQRFQLTQDRIDASTGTIIPTLAKQFGGGVPNTRYSFTQTATASPPPTGLGENRPALTLNGYAAGMMRTNSYEFSTLGTPATSSTVYPVISVPFGASSGEATTGGLRLTLDPATSRAAADVTVFSLADSDAGFAGANFQLGGPDTPNRPTSAYIDASNFALRERVTNGPDGAVQTSVAYIQAGETANPVTYQDGSTQISMVTWDTIARANPTRAAGFFPDVNICACDYLKWGFLSVTAFRQTGQGTAHDEDRGNLLLWVAGQTSTASSIPTTGTATYSGMAIANINAVSEGGARSYVAGGNFSNTVDFGARSGTVSITNLDGRNYTGTTSLIASSPHFAGTLSTSGGTSQARVAPVDGILIGSFYGAAAPGRPGVGPAEMGGQFALSGTNYTGAGIFAAKR